MATKVYKITKVNAAGKYCEIWLEGYERTDNLPADTWSIAPKWYELNNAVEAAGLDGHVLNRGFVGLRVVLDIDDAGQYKVAAITTSKPEETDEASPA